MTTLKISIVRFFCFAATLLTFAVTPVCSETTPVTTFQNSRFGKIIVLGKTDNVREVAIFISGSHGLNEKSIEIATALSARALVVGIDGSAYRNGIEQGVEKCAYLSGELVRLAQSVENALKLPSYVKPHLSGYGEGASLAFVAYAGSPSSFAGLLTAHFCPEIHLSKDICDLDSISLRREDQELSNLLPGRPEKKWAWVTAYGERDSSCLAKPVRNFIRDLGVGYFAELPSDNSSYENAVEWIPTVWSKLLNQAAAIRRGEGPLIPESAEIEVAPTLPERKELVLLMSGDGGWSPVEVEMSRQFARHGYPVVGFDSLQYFWNQRSPEETAARITEISTKYLKHWNKERVVLVGFKLGAESAAVAFSHFDRELRQKIKAIMLLSPGRLTSLKAEIGDWINAPPPALNGQIKISTQIPKMGGVRMFCAYGKEAGSESLCTQLSAYQYILRPFPGDSHFDGKYAETIEPLLTALASK